VTAKVYVLRLKTHVWTEEDFESLILGYIASHPGIAEEVGKAVRRSYQTVTGKQPDRVVRAKQIQVPKIT
jgi:hypothetical protein